jgi:phosphate transport system substrate-binding protein
MNSFAEKALIAHGSYNAAPVLQAWSQNFLTSNSEARIVISGTHPEKAFKRLIEGSVQMAFSVHPMDESIKSEAAKKGIEIKERQVGWEGIALLANKDVGVGELTLDQVRDIFRGRITNWNQVGGRNLEIDPNSLEYPAHGSVVWFTRNVLGTNDYPEIIDTRDTPKLLLMHNKNKSGAVAFLGISIFNNLLKHHPEIEMKPIKIKQTPDSPAVAATRASVKDGSYPLTIPIYMYWNAKNHNKAGKQFAMYCSEMAESFAEANRLGHTMYSLNQ